MIWPNEKIWLGFNDVEKEDKFVDGEGLQMSWDNWKSGEPNGWTAEGWFIFMSRIIY